MCLMGFDVKKELINYHNNPDNEAVYSYFVKDDMWKILNIQRYEPSHSAFLAWFFNQNSGLCSQVKALIYLLIIKGDTNLLKNGWNKTADMESFVDAVLAGAFSIKSVSVVPEQQVDKLSKIRFSDKIDIYIRCDISIDLGSGEEGKSLEIFIENKIDSSENLYGKKVTKSNPSKEEQNYLRHSQTERYYYAFSKEGGNRQSNSVDYQLFAYLTPHGGGCKSNNYILITYQDLVDNIFDNYLKRNDVDQNNKELVRAYLHNLGNPFNKKGIIAMEEEERNLLSKFFERNRSLFMATLEAKILELKKSTDVDEQAEALEFEQMQESFEKAVGYRRYYSINGNGSYKMYQVIEEFVKWKIKKGNLFTDIKAELDKVNSQLIGEKEDDVKKGGHGTKPHSFEYGGKTYYVTKELGDKNQSDLFYKFRKYVNKQYKDFQIVEITK